jgi:3-oxoacyl-[acyl-carrier-protein] synthase-3
VIRSVVLGTGSYLPERVVTNEELATRVDTSDEWIVQRTGIRQRHIVADGETTSDLGVKAAERALAAAGVAAADIDLIIVATATPDHTFPATAVEVQHKLGVVRGAAFDVQAVCSGFVYALTVGDAMLKTGLANKALVIGADSFSRILDWEDRTTCVLFGDGAGAVVLGVEEGAGTTDDRGVLTAHLRADGRHVEKLYTDGGPSSTQTVGHVRMHGQEVFKFAVGAVTDVIKSAFAATGFDGQTIDWFIPHQANRRIIESSARKLGIALEKVVITVDKHGNTSAASIPLALDSAVRSGQVKRGDVVLLEAMGGGFTWGAAIVRW